MNIINKNNMAKDKCVMCGEETPYDETVHIDLRVGYIEGAGQLCIDCYDDGEKEKKKNYVYTS